MFLDGQRRTALVWTIVVWKLISGTPHSWCHVELRKNHSGMETSIRRREPLRTALLRKNHSGMETDIRLPFQSIRKHRLRKNHSGMETVIAFHSSKSRSSLRKNHSGMETWYTFLNPTIDSWLRKNHSGMETFHRWRACKFPLCLLRKNHSGMETGIHLL